MATLSVAMAQPSQIYPAQPDAVRGKAAPMRLRPAPVAFPIGVVATTAISATTLPTAGSSAADLRLVRRTNTAKPSRTIAQNQQNTPDELLILSEPSPTETPTIEISPSLEAPAASPPTSQPTSPQTEPPQSTTPSTPEGAAPAAGESTTPSTPEGAAPAAGESTIPSTPGGNAPAAGEGEATEPSEPRVLVSEVAVQGVTGELEDEVYRAIRTRPGQTTTRTQLQEDINAIFATGYFANVQATPEDTPLGVRVTFVVEPNPVLQAVQVEGNTVISTAEIDQIFKDQYGKTLNLQQLQRSIQALTKQYQDRGYVLAQVVDVPKISPDGVVVLQLAEGIVESIKIKFIDKEGADTDAAGKPIRGRTRDFIVTREMETKPGDVFNRPIAERDLQRVFGLGIFDDVKLELDPGEDPRKVNVIVNVAERSASNIAVGAGISSASGLFGTVSYQQQNLGGNNQRLGAEVQVGQRELLFDVNFSDPWIAGDPFRTSYTVNGFRRRNISLIFDEGNNNVQTNNFDGDRSQPRVVRTGGGVTFSRPLSKNLFARSDWTASLGFRYQGVVIEDSEGNLIDPKAPQVDGNGRVVGRGRDLSWSGESKDDLLTLQFGVVQDRRNNPLTPTSGSLLRVGTEQSIPVGRGSIFFNRLRASYSFYLPTRLLKINPDCRDVDPRLVDAARPKRDPNACPQAFAFNLQAGTVIGDLPPYEAFALGGSNSVRGYDEGGVGSGKSFAEMSAEYRFPIFSVISGALFFDAATDLGSGSSVKGNPAGIRDKPGSGFGYGLGVRVQSPLGPIRIDYGFNNEGDSRFSFGIGERF
jgi:outer membrane protein insertion porin family